VAAARPTEGVSRGGGWVAAQFVLMAAIVAGGLAGPSWPGGASATLLLVGAATTVGGAALAVWSARALGRALTPFPRPAAGGELAEGGPYRVVRHPIYSGGLAFFLGISLWLGPVALACTGALAVLWALKAGVEERHLRTAYPGYAEYAARVTSRIVPFVY
jgi:protein-S-isoprenylcysteine O-methyltransferase Ste14